MVTATHPQDVLSTKLHRPRVTADLVHRPRLKKLLYAGLDRPLILLAAPAGFGKSTLVSAWLETCDLPHAWISLDAAENDLGAFLAYFLSAVQGLFPNALPNTSALLSGVSLPPTGAVARTVINELDRIERDFVLILDDYHTVRDSAVHELLGQLVQHPPHSMHLVITTRQDPPLPLGVLRARNQIAEIRGQDLRFTPPEIAAFVERALDAPLTADMLATLAEKTEGWAAGLRFATLALRYGGTIDGRLSGLDVENRYVLDYLMSEVLTQVPLAMRSFLLKTSILERMCDSLCTELVGREDPTCHPQECLAWLAQANMFTVALDPRGEWYRYHPLFRDLLRDQLSREDSADSIAALHARASAWFARQGSLEEAVQHSLLGGDMPAAVRLIAEQRHALMDAEQWQLHHRTLRMFPEDAIAIYPDLMLMATWIARLGQSSPTHVLELIDRCESLVALPTDQSEHAVQLHGEIDTLRVIIACEAASDPADLIALARRALATTPRAWYYVRSTAWLYMSVAHQLAGRLDLAYATLAEGAAEDVAEDGAVRARIAGSRCFVEWMAGDLPAVTQGAAHLREVSETHRRRESLGWSYYLLSSVAYERNDLETAEAHARTLEDLRYVARPMAYLQSAFVYASIYQARGQPDQAQRKLELAFDYLRETRTEGLLPLAQAFQADLAVRQGDLGAARHWATTIAPFVPLGLMPYFFAPQLTLTKFFLAQDTPGSRDEAFRHLLRLHAFVTATHNTRFVVEVLALQALLRDAQGDAHAALALLTEAVGLAERGGLIRLFVDLGPRLAILFDRLLRLGIAPGYVGSILRAFREATAVALPKTASGSAVARTELVEPLTNREREILALLAQRLTDKEIAGRLVISPMTVKRHCSTIYQKLQVGGRREAVDKATRFGLL